MFANNKYDKILTLSLLILEAIYFSLIRGLDEKAARYPMFIFTLLIILTLALGVKSFFYKSKEKSESIFEGFQGKQFLSIIVLSAVYIALIDLIGFFTVSFIYLNLIMIGLKAKIKYSILTSLGFCILIYLGFVIFLKVPVPRGFLI